MQRELALHPFYPPSYPQKISRLPRRLRQFFANGRLILLRNAILLLLSLLLAIALSACSSQPKKVAEPIPGRTSQTAIKSRVSGKILQQPAFTPHQLSSSLQPPPPIFRWPPGFVRIAMLPLYTEVPTGGALPDLDQIFRAECSKLLDLEIIHISRNEMLALLGKDQIASTAPIPESFLRRLREKHDVQGILFTDLTIFRPYRPINIGVRSKLVHLPSMDVLWAAEGILDSAEPGIAASAVQFAERNLKSPEKSAAPLILQSPRRYAAFVANGIYGTLPNETFALQEYQKSQQFLGIPTSHPTPTPYYY